MTDHHDVLTYIDPDAIDGHDRELTPREREILDTINRRVAGAADLSEMIDFLFETTRPVCPCDRVSVAFLEDDDQRVVSHYTRADYDPVLLRRGYAQDLGRSSLRRVLERREPRIIRDLSEYLRYTPNSASSRILVREGVQSSMTCPLIVEDRPVGFLFRSSRQPDAYGPHQAFLHLEVAERLGQAVEKAYRIEQLVKLTDAYNEMLAFVTHELKSPVASFIMDADILIGGYVGELSEEQTKKLERMRGKATHLMALIRDYLDLARIETGSMSFHPKKNVDLVGDVIEEAAELVVPQAEERSVTVEREFGETPLHVECDPDLMKIVLVNLLSNAIKYGNENGVVRVEADRADDLFAVSVWNEGPGFSESERNSLFRKFSRLESPELKSRKGSGVGLYTVWRIVQLHGGTVQAESEKGEWARFTIEIPQPPGVKRDGDDG